MTGGPGGRPATRLVLATRNDHKTREFARLLGGAPAGARDRGEPGGQIELESLPEHVELPPETADTFAGNALPKARAAAAAVGRPAIADDSGIESTALGGAPGVRSARFAGEHATDEENLAKLRAQAPAGSGLTYVCALAYVDPATGVEHVVEGRCTGTMSANQRGDRGFGYDPVFLPDDHPGGRTMAELSDGEKDAVSHRGHAARALLAWLEA